MLKTSTTLVVGGILLLIAGALAIALVVTHDTSQLTNDESVLEYETGSRARDDVMVTAQLERYDQQRLVNDDIRNKVSDLIARANFFSVFVEDQLMIFADEVVGGRAEAQTQCDAVAYDIIFATKLVTCIYDGEVMYSDAFLPG